VFEHPKCINFHQNPFCSLDRKVLFQAGRCDRDYLSILWFDCTIGFTHNKMVCVKSRRIINI
jgi:hypothetical protein